jgi:uncharacterized protein
MVKPVGASCNLRCDYCYYLPVAEGYAAPAKRMPLEVFEDLVAGFLPRAAERVTISWQGGEPTLAGLSWFESAMQIIQRHARRCQVIEHALQTNGTLLNDRWGKFLQEHRVLVGLSLDGRQSDHDRHRSDRRGGDSYLRVMEGLQTLRRYRVEHNILTVLNRDNVEHPDAVWKHLMSLGVNWVQFIPAVEWRADEATGEPRLAEFSPPAEAFGRFLCRVFDRWFEHHRHDVSVRLFDVVLSALVHGRATECTLSPSCAGQLTIEHDGAVYGCDHFVEPQWRLGSITRPTPLTIEGHAPPERGTDPASAEWWPTLDGERFEAFGRRKLDLGDDCRQCEHLKLCYGGCPKHRPQRGDVPGASVLCAGYRRFFDHALPRLRWVADYVRRGQTPPREVPTALRSRDKPRRVVRKRKGRRR